MKYRMRLLALVMIMMLAMPFVSALAAVSCSSCSRSVDTATCNYCPYCGARVQSKMEITELRAGNDGTVSLAWKDGGNNGPYTVLYRYYVDENYFSDTQQKQIYWNNGDPAAARSAVLNAFVPGYDYWVMVEDKNGDVVRELYRSPVVHFFEDFNITTELKPMVKSGSTRNQLSSFSAKDLKNGTGYGIKLRMNFSSQSRNKTYTVMVAFVDPYGVPIREGFFTDVVIERGWDNWGWDFYNLDWYFDRVEQMYDTAPAGKYTALVFLNGQLAVSEQFSVN